MSLGQRTATVLSASGAEYSIIAHAVTDTGRVRSVNEDAALVAPPVFVVADGMGGHQHGDRASQETVAAFEHLRGGSATTVDAILAAVRSAEQRVRSISVDEFSGTTLTGVALVESATGVGASWMVFNVGDSRVYAVSSGGLAQVSVDHSAVQELIDAGSISSAEARTHPDRNIVTAAIGTGQAEPDVWLRPAGGPQRFLLCSDGLTKELEDEEIAGIVCVGRPEDAAEALVARTLERGATDNVTVVVIDVTVVAEATSGVPAHLESTVPRGKRSS